MRLLMLILALALPLGAASQTLQACNQYRAQITRSAFETFGPGAPVADLVAQLHQESGCRADARSRVGAQGIGQFMPATAQDMAARHAACAPANPLSAEWGIRCSHRYMRELLRQFASARTESDQWAFAMSSYNGGAGWARRDQRACMGSDWRTFPCEPCDELAWWDNVERTPDARRAKWAVKENRGYPRRIMCAIAPRYEAEGWGRGVGCNE